jgi:hypothetical protein
MVVKTQLILILDALLYVLINIDAKANKNVQLFIFLDFSLSSRRVVFYDHPREKGQAAVIKRTRE